MKTNRPKKRPPRLSTRILLAVIAAALVINGYCAWQILGKPLQTEQTQTAADVSSEEQGLLEAECAQLLRDFFRRLREKRRAVKELEL